MKIPWQVRAAWERRVEKIAIAIAWHLPHRLVLWCYIRVGTHATTGKYSDTIVPEITMTEALQRWYR